MPNWAEQQFHVVGTKAEVDRLVRTGFKPRRKGKLDDELDLHALCPSLRSQHNDDSHKDAVVLMRYRTRTQACFVLLSAWSYPVAFYERLAEHWPTLIFMSSVNEDMGTYGGVVLVMDGVVTDLVKDYDGNYNRRKHRRQVRKAIDAWGNAVTAGYDWRFVAHAAWTHKSMPFDARFDDDFWFFFRSREEMLAFRARYGGNMPLRRVGKEWKRTR